MAEVGSAFVSIVPSARGFGRSLSKEIGGDLDNAGRRGGQQFQQGFQQGGKRGGGFAAIGKGMAGAFVAGFAAVGIAGLARQTVQFFGEAVNAASDLQETINKSDTIFGDNAEAIRDWADTAAESAGLSKSAALEAAAGFGNMFSQIGFAADEAADLSTQVVQMSADLGSFNNLPTEDVAQRISAAFRGEYDSLQLLIPNINAARVETEAMNATGKESAKQLTAQEKAAAVLAIVQRDGTAAMGDFARTSDGLTNTQKILTAEWENAKAQLGEALIPTLTAFATVLLEKGVPALEKMIGWVEDNQDAITNFGITVGQVGLGVIEGILRIGSTFAGLYATTTRISASIISGFVLFSNSLIATAERAFGWVPGVGDKLATARAELRVFGEVATSRMDAVADKAEGVSRGMDAAADEAAGLRRELEAFKPSYTTTFRTRYITEGRPPSRAPGGQQVGLAGGGYVSGPGTATSDSIPAWLSNGEYVVNAKATQQHRALLEAINAGRFANGGPVGAAVSSTGLAFPDRVTLVDRSGALLGHMDVKIERANAAVGRRIDSRVRR